MKICKDAEIDALLLPITNNSTTGIDQTKIDVGATLQLFEDHRISLHEAINMCPPRGIFHKYTLVTSTSTDSI